MTTTNAQNVNKGSYATYKIFDSISYTCIEHLMKENETVWKLLKYNDPDAWNKPDLTLEEKAALIYAGQDDLTQFRVFLDIGQPDVWTQEICNIRIAPYSAFPNNKTVGTISVMFEVYAHYKVNHLSNYKTRIDMVMQQFLATFNGLYIGGIGRLFFDRLGSQDNRLEYGGQLPYKGRWVIMSNRTD